MALARLDDLGRALPADLAPATRDQIVDRLDTVIERMDDWARRYAFVRRERVVPLALSVTAAAPFADAVALASVGRVSLWVFALDDAMDEQHLPISMARRRARACDRVLRGRPTVSDDPFLVALRDVRDDLSRYPLFPALGEVWANALRGTIRGMLREDDWREQARAGSDLGPSYAAYVANGRYSIGGPPHVWASILTIGDDTTPAHLPYLRAMERLASICVRLSNDLRSAEKERAEGKLNSLVILARDAARDGMSAANAWRAAEARVRRDIQRCRDGLRARRARPRTATGWPEAATADIGCQVSRFYEAHDYHTFTRERDV